MSYLTDLSTIAFSLGGTSYLGVLREITGKADQDLAEVGGIADRYEYNRVVKQGQSYDFSIEQLNGDSLPMTNLDVSAYLLGGDDFIGRLRSFTATVTTPTKEVSSLAQLDRVPVPVGGQKLSISSGHVVEVSNALYNACLTASGPAGFDTTVALTVGGMPIAAPMTIKTASVKHSRGDVQMEDVGFELAGTPTQPSSGSTLLHEILFGSGVIAFFLDNGDKEYISSSALLTRVEYRIEDAAAVNIGGTLVIQGSQSTAPTGD